MQNWQTREMTEFQFHFCSRGYASHNITTGSNVCRHTLCDESAHFLRPLPHKGQGSQNVCDATGKICFIAHP